MTKNLIRVPLDQFAFLEFEHEGTPDSALIEYKRVLEASRTPKSDSTGTGLTAKEVDSMLDDWFGGKGVNSDLYSKCNPEQSKWLQAIKRSLARVKAKHTRTVDETFEEDNL